LGELAGTVGDANALKAVGQGSGTNTSGFSALFGGRSFGGNFTREGAYFWSSTQAPTYPPISMELASTYTEIFLRNRSETEGISIRCLKDSFSYGIIPEPPLLSSPSNGATDVKLPPTLSWNASEEAKSYRLQVSTDNQFATIVYDQSNVTKVRQVSGLSKATTYYWRVNATNDFGTSDWSNPSWSFSTEEEIIIGIPCPGLPILTDNRDGKVYNTVQIGDQCWLKENLDIGTRMSGNLNQSNDSIIEKYCYNDDSVKCNTYGGLYQWNEAMQYATNEGAQGICPTGWHIPNISEFQTLNTTISNDGNALKEIGQGSGSGAGTNKSGFSALLSGLHDQSGSFNYLGTYTYFWGSKNYDTTNAIYMFLSSTNSNINLSNIHMDFAFSVRCLKD